MAKSGKILLYRYISKEFLANFFVSFSFFFAIFFVNSILLLVQRILLRNIDFMTMLEMVLLSMPQFLIYTIPFATLSGSAMVLGDLSSNNELLALKASGVREDRVYRPIIFWSLIFSLLTFFVSDYLLPWSNIVYRERLTLLMRDMPTFEIEANGTNTIGNIVIANGQIDDRNIYNIIMTNTDRTDQNKSVLSERGNITMIDPTTFLYRIDLTNPYILITNSSDINQNVTADAENATLYLDFSEQVPSLTSTNPVNLSSSVLRANIIERQERQDRDRLNFYQERENYKLNIARELKRGLIGESVDSSSIDNSNSNLTLRVDPPLDFYAQYYKAELTKKYSLSLACFFLTLVALPLGTIKVRYGKLTGFAISLLVAVMYWYMMFFSQLEIFSISSDPYLLIFLPDLAVAALAFLFSLIRRGMDR